MKKHKSVFLILLLLISLLSCINEDKNSSIKNYTYKNNIYEAKNIFIDYPSPVELSFRLQNANVIDTNRLLQSNFLNIPSIKRKYLTSKNNLNGLKGIIHQNILLAIAINDTIRVKKYFEEYQILLKANNLNIELEQVNNLLNYYDNDSIFYFFGAESLKAYKKKDYKYELSFIYEYIYYLLKYFKELEFKKNTHLLSGILDLRLTLKNFEITPKNGNLQKILKYMIKIYDYNTKTVVKKDLQGNSSLKTINEYVFKKNDTVYFNKIYDIVNSERNNVIGIK